MAFDSADGFWVGSIIRWNPSLWKAFRLGGQFGWVDNLVGTFLDVDVYLGWLG